MSLAEAPRVDEREVVLAVDDNEQNLQLLEEYLTGWGYEVVLARDGLEALQSYPQHDPSIIVLDVMMPNMDGYEACARIKGEVAIVHGRDDDVIPHTHAPILAEAMSGAARKELLVTGLLSHTGNSPLDPRVLAAEGRTMIAIVAALARAATHAR